MMNGKFIASNMISGSVRISAAITDGVLQIYIGDEEYVFEPTSKVEFIITGEPCAYSMLEVTP